MTILATELDTMSARAALDQIKAQMAELTDTRRRLLRDLADRARANGREVVEVHNANHLIREEGAKTYIVETFDRWNCGTVRHRAAAYRVPQPELVIRRPAGTIRGSSSFVPKLGDHATISIDRGVFTVLLVDGADVVAIKDGGGDTESGHRRSINRLRAMARHDGIRVRVRDRDITLLDPLDNALHQGDVLTAFAFLLNIDLDTPVIGDDERVEGARA